VGSPGAGEIQANVGSFGDVSMVWRKKEALYRLYHHRRVHLSEACRWEGLPSIPNHEPTRRRCWAAGARGDRKEAGGDDVRCPGAESKRISRGKTRGSGNLGWRGSFCRATISGSSMHCLACKCNCLQVVGEDCLAFQGYCQDTRSPTIRKLSLTQTHIFVSPRELCLQTFSSLVCKESDKQLDFSL
jgi:hypothetical protein